MSVHFHPRFHFRNRAHFTASIVTNPVGNITLDTKLPSLRNHQSLRCLSQHFLSPGPETGQKSTAVQLLCRLHLQPRNIRSDFQMQGPIPNPSTMCEEMAMPIWPTVYDGIAWSEVGDIAIATSEHVELLVSNEI